MADSLCRHCTASMQLLNPAGALQEDRERGVGVIVPPWTYLYVDTNRMMVAASLTRSDNVDPALEVELEVSQTLCGSE